MLKPLRRIRESLLQSFRSLSKLIEKQNAILFIILAVLVLWSQLEKGTYFGPEMTTPYPINYILSVFLSAVVLVGGGILVAAVIPILVMGHMWLKRRFEESVDSIGKPRALSQLLTSCLLNIVALLIVMGLVPPSALASALHLETWMEVFQQPAVAWTVTRFVSVFFLILPGAIGPLILHWIRMCRQRGNMRSGARSLVALQLVCYLSWVILCLWWAFPNEITVGLHTRFVPEQFLLYFLSPVLPSTLLCIVVIRETGQK
jgi:hypothetical protein